MNGFHHRLRLGVQRNRLKFFLTIFAAYSVIWTLIESTTALLALKGFAGPWYYLTVIAASVTFACFRAYPPSSITFKAFSNTKFNVSFGDVFERDGHVAIPVNEFFDSQLGLPVSPKTLHGIVIDRFFGGHASTFDQLVASELAQVRSSQANRTTGKTARYPLGTAASIRTNSHKFILFALCKTDISTCKASATVPHLVKALHGLCEKARVILNGDKLIVPLTGSGLAGIGLPPHHLLQLILLLLVKETRKGQFALEVDVVLHPDKYDDIDLSAVESFWR